MHALKDKKAFVAIFVFIFSGLSGAAAETQLLRYPDIHKDKIVFCYGGDLYTASSTGQDVKRLTSFPGEELLPKFSPDGEQIAFTAEFEGNKDIYVISARGGKPKRLTFHPAAEYVVDWHPDGSKIIFRSNASSFSYRFNRLHAVPAQGGLPVVLELPEAELSGFNDKGDKIAFCRTGVDDLLFKRYRGGKTPNIWTYDFSNRRAEPVIADPSINHHPMWIGDGIYFVSDRGETREQNLWRYDCRSKEVHQLTSYKDWGVRWPSKGGEEIIYEHEGRLCVYDVKSGKIRLLEVEIPQLPAPSVEQSKNVKGYLSGSPALSPDGKKMILNARGDLFLLEPEKNSIVNLTLSPGANDRNPIWSPDGSSFAYISDRSGEDQIYVQKAGGGLDPVQVSHCSPSRLGMLNWSPDGRWIGYADHRASFHILEIGTGETRKIFFDAYLGSVKFVSAAWSPDSRWLVYAAGNSNWFTSIHLYSLDSGSSHRITDEFVYSHDPRFDPRGRYLYWIADCQVNVEDSYWDNGHHMINPSKIVAATLRKDMLSPFSAAAANPAPEKGTEPFPLRIDVEGLGQRITALPIEDAGYLDLFALKERLIYRYEPAKGDSSIKMFDLAEQKESVLLKDALFCVPAAQGDRIAYRASGGIGVVDIKPDQKAGDGQIDLSGLNVAVDSRQEWRQMFNEAWRIQRDFFFDEKLHGVDWESMKRKYEVFLPYVASRRDLNYLIEDLFSELGQSHVETSGGDLPELPQSKSGLLGVDLEMDKDTRLYRIAKIYRGQNWDPVKCSPLTLPGLNIEAGDYLLAIDGAPLREGVNPDAFLENKAGAPVTLTIREKSAAGGFRTVIVKPAAFSERTGDFLRYNDWVLNNIESVSRATGGQVEYLHIPDTYISGIESFFRYAHPQMDKQGLIIDIRFNSGGYPPYWMIERLNRKLLCFSHLPHGKAPIMEPDYGFFGAKVCLTNEWAESGGEKFTATFRLLDGGPIIGQRTSGNLASTGGFRLIDGGVIVYPAEGPQNDRGENIIEGVGVSPDIAVVNGPEDLMRGKDPQLERSIQEILMRLGKAQKK